MNAAQEEMFDQMADLVAMQTADEILAAKFDGVPETGTMAALQHLHRCLYDGMYDDAGQWRTTEVCNNGMLRYIRAAFIPAVAPIVERMPHATFEEAVDKFLEMMLVHPFANGNGHSLRLWLDQMLLNATGKRVRWNAIRYSRYIYALRMSASDASAIRSLLHGNLVNADEPCHSAFAVRDHMLHYKGRALCRLAADGGAENTPAGYVNLHIRIPDNGMYGMQCADGILPMEVYIDGWLP